MNRVLDRDATLLELVGKLLDLVLGARNSHAIPRDEHHQLREGEQWSEVLDGGGMDGSTLGTGGGAGGLDLRPEAAEEHIEQ